ncbi:MAG: adenosylcobinamide-GDP ribazoletransferase [Kiritimatiellia bacterium]
MSQTPNIFRSFVTALRTLTILPVPGPEAARPADAFYFFPLVGELIGASVLLAAWVMTAAIGWTWGAALAGVFILAGLTRALHLDGLGDTVDACFATRSRERRLQIMKDPHIGVFGVVAVCLALLVKLVSLERLCASGQWSMVILPVVLARMTMVLVAVCLPYARPGGGKAGGFFAAKRPAHLLVAVALTLALCYLHAGSNGLAAAAGAFALGMLLVQWMKHNFGGATGDLLGFSGESTECIAYFFLALTATF